VKEGLERIRFLKTASPFSLVNAGGGTIMGKVGDDGPDEREIAAEQWFSEESTGKCPVAPASKASFARDGELTAVAGDHGIAFVRNATWVEIPWPGVDLRAVRAIAVLDDGGIAVAGANGIAGVVTKTGRFDAFTSSRSLADVTFEGVAARGSAIVFVGREGDRGIAARLERGKLELVVAESALSRVAVGRNVTFVAGPLFSGVLLRASVEPDLGSANAVPSAITTVGDDMAIVAMEPLASWAWLHVFAPLRFRSSTEQAKTDVPIVAVAGATLGEAWAIDAAGTLLRRSRYGKWIAKRQAEPNAPRPLAMWAKKGRVVVVRADGSRLGLHRDA
jgi:hypothetical protein